jgi:hypothetical protein
MRTKVAAILTIRNERGDSLLTAAGMRPDELNLALLCGVSKTAWTISLKMDDRQRRLRNLSGPVRWDFWCSSHKVYPVDKIGSRAARRIPV